MPSTVFLHLKTFLENNDIELMPTDSSFIYCTRLPVHYRSKRALPQQFVVLSTIPIPDGTEVSVIAGNSNTPNGRIINNEAVFHGQVALFDDLRFDDYSGKRSEFNLTINIHSKTKIVATVPQVIKITADGPRRPRRPKQISSAPSSSNRFSPISSPNKKPEPVQPIQPAVIHVAPAYPMENHMAPVALVPLFPAQSNLGTEYIQYILYSCWLSGELPRLLQSIPNFPLNVQALFMDVIRKDPYLNPYAFTNTVENLVATVAV